MVMSGLPRPDEIMSDRTHANLKEELLRRHQEPLVVQGITTQQLPYSESTVLYPGQVPNGSSATYSTPAQLNKTGSVNVNHCSQLMVTMFHNCNLYAIELYCRGMYTTKLLAPLVG